MCVWWATDGADHDGGAAAQADGGRARRGADRALRRRRELGCDAGLPLVGAERGRVDLRRARHRRRRLPGRSVCGGSRLGDVRGVRSRCGRDGVGDQWPGAGPMTTFPAATYLSNAARTESEMKTAFEDFLAATKQLPGGVSLTTLTIVSDQVTPVGGLHRVDTEAAGATDNLAQILQTNLPDGSVLAISVANNARAVVAKHAAGGTGQLSLVGAADFTMTDITTWLLLRRNGTQWDEVGRWYGAAAAAHRIFYGTPGLGQNTFTGRQEWAKGANVASAATLSPGTDGNYFHVTGTTTITAIASMPAGTALVLEFDGACQITHNATSLIL